MSDQASRWRTPTIIEPWTQRVCDQEHEERAQNGCHVAIDNAGCVSRAARDSKRRL
jgi:hypothetical protein